MRGKTIFIKKSLEVKKIVRTFAFGNEGNTSTERESR